MLVSNSTLSSLPVAYAVAGPGQNNVEIHSINANAWVVLDPQINVLLDPKSKVALVRKVLLTQLILLDL